MTAAREHCADDEAGIDFVVAAVGLARELAYGKVGVDRHARLLEETSVGDAPGAAVVADRLAHAAPGHRHLAEAGVDHHGQVRRPPDDHVPGAAPEFGGLVAAGTVQLTECDTGNRISPADAVLDSRKPASPGESLPVSIRPMQKPLEALTTPE